MCRGVDDVETHELEPPFGDVACGLLVVYDVPKAVGGHDHYRVVVEVVPELALGDEHGVEKFLDLLGSGSSNPRGPH